ncbi:hypothetical protein B4135_1515 [Caldibacillus debilis]|uniref:Uncharacterized protein n=1 Tax=Caldibacillus debilis TaxID=301148 RepID=A0A150MBT8_9BACI|nr:hypothetical protein B4135_1515 [Caldibacillus debilis]
MIFLMNYRELLNPSRERLSDLGTMFFVFRFNIEFINE